MQTTYLQAIAVTNAKAIAMQAALIAMHVDAAREHRVDGEKAFMIAAFNKANKQRAKLATLVQTQRAIKGALADNARDVRIKAKVARLVAKAGFVEQKPKEELTSHEIEKMLDAMLTAFIPAKIDTRPADHPSFQIKK